jgi:hypothetical protein
MPGNRPIGPQGPYGGGPDSYQKLAEDYRALQVIYKTLGEDYKASLAPKVFMNGELGLRPTPDNPGFLLNALQKFDGATAVLNAQNANITTGAASINRTQQVTDISSVVSSLPTELDGYPRFVGYFMTQQWTATTPFAVMPFLVLLENGESYTAQDSNNTNPVTAITAGMAAGSERIIQYGPLLISNLLANATTYSIKLSLDLTDACNRYSKHYQKKEFEEENPLVFILGVMLIGTANTLHTGKGWAYYAYHNKERSWGQ